MEFNKKWNEYILYDLAIWKNGLAFKNINFSDKGKPIIKIAELKNGITEQTKFTNGDYGEDVYLKKNDLIFSWSGNPKTSIDTFLYDLPEGYLNQHIFKVTEKKEIITKYFLYYILKYLNPMFQNIASNKQTTGLGHVTIADLKKIKVRVPSLELQHKILDIIKNIDNKIYNNNQINDNLQNILLSIFNKFLADNSNFNETTIKDAVKKIGTGADAIQKAPIVEYDTGIRCIRVGDMTNLRTKYQWGFTKMTEKDYENYKLNVGDIIVTRTAVNGLSYLIEDNMKVVCNNGLIRMSVNNKYNPLYIYLYLQTKDFYNYVHRIDAETSVRPNMKVDFFTAYKIREIPIEKQNEICRKLLPLRKKQQSIIIENERLANLRDTLLPKLMNGEIDLDKVVI